MAGESKERSAARKHRNALPGRTDVRVGDATSETREFLSFTAWIVDSNATDMEAGCPYPLQDRAGAGVIQGFHRPVRSCFQERFMMLSKETCSLFASASKSWSRSE